MIKAVATLGGKPSVFLGLSQENCDRLVKGEPIQVALSDLVYGDESQEWDGRTQIVLVGGKTEKAIAEEMRAQGLISEEAFAVLKFDSSGNPVRPSS